MTSCTLSSVRLGNLKYLISSLLHRISFFILDTAAWGNRTQGHWTTVVIWRQGKRNRGFHLDSSGASDTRGRVFDKIRKAFTGKKDRFSWTQTTCFPQQELECGFRTVEAIRLISRAHNEGKDIDECIRIASMQDRRDGEYCPLRLRAQVADRWEIQRRSPRTAGG